MVGSDCCNGSCNNGVCGPACQPDGVMCNAPSECCSGACTNGLCGASQCPSDGSQCGDCLAQSCCNQFANCIASPSCLMTVGCVTTCIQNGGGFFQCALQCQVFGNQAALQLIGCIGQNCGNSCP